LGILRSGGAEAFEPIQGRARPPDWSLPDWSLPDWSLPDWSLPDWRLPAKAPEMTSGEGGDGRRVLRRDYADQLRRPHDDPADLLAA
jgi:hypothetical protein